MSALSIPEILRKLAATSLDVKWCLLGPLHLLALEVQEKLLDKGVNYSLLTDEEDLRKHATHVASTVGK